MYGTSPKRTCFFDYHNDDFFGFSRADTGLSKTRSKDWNYPSLAKKRENTMIMNNLNDEISWRQTKKCWMIT